MVGPFVEGRDRPGALPVGDDPGDAAVVEGRPDQPLLDAEVGAEVGVDDAGVADHPHGLAGVTVDDPVDRLDDGGPEGGDVGAVDGEVAGDQGVVAGIAVAPHDVGGDVLARPADLGQPVERHGRGRQEGSRLPGPQQRAGVDGGQRLPGKPGGQRRRLGPAEGRERGIGAGAVLGVGLGMADEQQVHRQM